MPLLNALVLGIVQGLTEFLPLSSSGHLTLAPFLFGWDEPSLAFVVAAHLGTAAAVVWVFREDVARLTRALLRWRDAEEPDRRLIRMLAIATGPAVIAGVAFRQAVGDALESPVLVSLLLGVTGYVLLSTETIVEHRETDPVEGQKKPRAIEAVEPPDALTVGVAQAIAILPGISRSGTTISAGMRRGLSRQAAARFSFLLSVPVILGAGLIEIPDMLRESGGGGGGAFAIGAIAAGLSGFVAIRWFLRVIQRRGLRPFGAYCFLVMVAGLLTALARG